VAKIPPLDENDFVRLLREVLEERLSRFDTTLNLKDRPAVVLVVGVNGVGKTTTIGKLAKFITTAGRSVVLGAADTFRAAAVDQLGTWAERAGVQMVRPQQEGQDPSSVAYQTLSLRWPTALTWLLSTRPADCRPRVASWMSSARSVA
jgi:fused signal recognition particle receptor